jgi:1-deoxy-D-xylulose-5-phosphate reductoisomerase
MIRRIVILGSTGSIGTQTLDVVRAARALSRGAGGGGGIEFEVVGIAGGSNAALLAEQAREFGVRAVACVGDGPLARDLPAGCKVFRGPTSAEELVRGVDADLVVAAIVGIAGLPSTLAAIERNMPVALANKETLVAAGELVLAQARENTAARCLLPIDSEHAGLWQCLLSGAHDAPAWAFERGEPHASFWKDNAPPHLDTSHVQKVILTASGGAFRTWTKDQIHLATPAQALKHPTWSMGAKVTVDCAGLMNKALELLEAHWLFGLSSEQLDVLVHPQSVVHAIAEFRDGSSVAQLASPDMRLPIHRALCWPRCVEAKAGRVDWRALRTLEFEPPDLARFPALGFAYHVMERGWTSGAILNGANEAAVAAFLREGSSMPFGRIADLVQGALEDVNVRPASTLANVLASHEEAREHVHRSLARA